MMKIAIILPSYKEAENLKVLLPKINEATKKMKCEYSITVVDAIEKMDDTELICEQNNAFYLPRKGGNHYGDAIRTGIAEANGEYIVIMDADGSHNPEDIARLYDKVIEGFDVVIGSRYVSGGNSHNGFLLKLMSLTVNCIYRFVFNINVKDVSNSFRIYESKKLKELNLSCENFDIVEEILILLFQKYKNLKVSEIPIFFDKRLHGSSKRDLLMFVFSYVATIVRLYKVKKHNSKT